MEKIEVENVIRSGTHRSVDATKYREVREVYLSVLPSTPPGLTPAEVLARIAPRLDPQRFPKRGKAGWWAKTVQLDLEARGSIVRAPKGPVRLWAKT